MSHSIVNSLDNTPLSEPRADQLRNNARAEDGTLPHGFSPGVRFIFQKCSLLDPAHKAITLPVAVSTRESGIFANSL